MFYRRWGLPQYIQIDVKTNQRLKLLRQIFSPFQLVQVLSVFFLAVRTAPLERQNFLPKMWPQKSCNEYLQPWWSTYVEGRFGTSSNRTMASSLSIRVHLPHSISLSNEKATEFLCPKAVCVCLTFYLLRMIMRSKYNAFWILKDMIMIGSLKKHFTTRHITKSLTTSCLNQHCASFLCGIQS